MLRTVTRFSEKWRKPMMLRKHFDQWRQAGDIRTMFDLNEKQLSGFTLEQDLCRTLDFWAWLNKPGFDVINIVEDEQWKRCSQAAGNLSEQARLPIDIAIAQAQAD